MQSFSSKPLPHVSHGKKTNPSIVQPNAPRPFCRLEISTDRVSNHRMEFSQRIAMGRDAASPRSIIPASDKSARFDAWFNRECDLDHLALLCIFVLPGASALKTERL